MESPIKPKVGAGGTAVIDPLLSFSFLHSGRSPKSASYELGICEASVGDLILAGKNCNLNMTGRYIRLPYHGTAGHKTIGNWYTTLLNAHGNPIKHYGDLDLEMSRQKLDQTGAIKQFLI